MNYLLTGPEASFLELLRYDMDTKDHSNDTEDDFMMEWSK